MKWRLLSIVAGTACTVLPAYAFACDFYLNSTFLRIPTKTAIGAGLQYQTGDFSTMILSGDVSIKAGTKAVVVPAIGLCRSDGGTSGSDSNDLTFGGGVGLNFWNNAQVAINAQSGIAIVSSDGATGMQIPFTLAGQFKASEQAAFFAGAGMSMFRVSGGGHSATETDPVLFGGATLVKPRFEGSAGISLHMGDGETTTSLNVGFRVPLGR